ncbi:MAG: hypothetical protein FWD71_06110 [Oscillospiraceae bacterium]|nr:hypothetical protein [Oscillospiraceae bacterium]
MKIKRIVSLLLIISIACLPILASCNGKTGGNSGTTAVGDTQDTAPVSATDPKEQFDPKLAPVDMGGYVFQVATRDDNAPYHNYPAHTRDLYAEAENGDLINDAVYRRNSAIEDKYNCKIEMDAYPENIDESTLNNNVDKAVKAGDKSYDLAMTHMMYGVTTATKGDFYDIATFPNIDITKPYWNKGANDGCSIGHRLFTGLSDYSFSTNENVYCIFFNKQLIQNYGIENPYQLVDNNQWTFDKFDQIIRVGYSDLNGNGVSDKDDQFGYASSNSVEFLWAGGSHMAAKDANDIPYMDFLSQRTTDIYAKAFDITNNDFTFSEDQWYKDDGIKIFQDGRAVFHGSQLCRVNNLRGVTFDYGIVPYPKFDSTQENYYSYVDGHASMMGIPLCLPHPEWTGMLIEDMSYLAYKDILPVYYDVVLDVKMVRDEESVAMLKILFDSKVFDPAYIMGLSLWIDWINNIMKKNTDIVSMYDKESATLQKNMQKTIDAILAIQ